MDNRSPDQKRLAARQGRLGEALVLRLHRRAVVPEGCGVTNGHAPKIVFSNLADVRHLDIVAYERATSAITSICEVKTVTSASQSSFGANGDCAAVMLRARDAGIALRFAVVRLKQKPPATILDREGFNRYGQWLLNHSEEYAIEQYIDGEFVIRGERFHIVPGGGPASQPELPL